MRMPVGRRGVDALQGLDMDDLLEVASGVHDELDEDEDDEGETEHGARLSLSTRPGHSDGGRVDGRRGAG